MTTTFDRLAPRIMRDLMAEPQFGFGLFDAAAIVGNAAHECGGFEKLQEIKPTVAGSRGGWGWFQWTGPRRKAFEAWAKRKGWKPDSYEANYSFLIRELLGDEKKAVAAVKKPVKLNDKVKAFEMAYERAGVKHYPSRNKWAQRALDAYNASLPAATVPTPPARPQAPVPAPVPQAPATPPASSSWASRILVGMGLAPKPPALPVEQPRAGFSETVQRAQLQLQALGYAEVGEADGLMGNRTKAAVRAFSSDQKPPLSTDGQLTDAMLAAIMKGARRPVAEARANATAKDLRQAGNEPAKALNGLGWLGNLIGLGGIAGAVNETGVLDSIKSAADTATGTIATIQGVVVGVVNAVQWMIAHWWLFAILAGVWMVYRVAKGVLELVVLFRQGVLTRKAIGGEPSP